MISALGIQVVQEIARRCETDETVVMQAFLTVALLHQQDLLKHIELIKQGRETEHPYILELEAS